MRQHASISTPAAATPQRTYSYGYDSLSRLTEARYSDSEGGTGHYDTRYDYDLNGNFISLVRRGAIDNKFKISNKGSKTKTIYNISIDKNTGVSIGEKNAQKIPPSIPNPFNKYRK